MKARIAGQTLGHSQSYIWKPTDQLKVIIGNAKMSVWLVVVGKCLPCTHRTLRPPQYSMLRPGKLGLDAAMGLFIRYLDEKGAVKRSSQIHQQSDTLLSHTTSA